MKKVRTVKSSIDTDGVYNITHIRKDLWDLMMEMGHAQDEYFGDESGAWEEVIKATEFVDKAIRRLDKAIALDPDLEG